MYKGRRLSNITNRFLMCAAALSSGAYRLPESWQRPRAMLFYTSSAVRSKISHRFHPHIAVRKMVTYRLVMPRLLST